VAGRKGNISDKPNNDYYEKRYVSGDSVEVKLWDTIIGSRKEMRLETVEKVLRAKIIWSGPRHNLGLQGTENYWKRDSFTGYQSGFPRDYPQVEFQN